MSATSLSAGRKSAGVGRTAVAAGGSLAWPAIVLFLSGMAALQFQVLWIKQLTLVVGVEVYAITAAVSAFFGGLALGGLLLGRWADGTDRPVRLYASIEAAAAGLSVATTFALSAAGPVFAALEEHSSLLAWTVVYLFVGIPAFFMGGTLPALTRAATADRKEASRNGGALYAANTAGAIVGALLPPFLLIPAFGIRGTAFVTAVIALCAAALALVFVGGRVPTSRSPRSAVISQSFATDARLAVALYTAAGAAALGYEIVWSQAMVQFTSTRAFAFSVMLATYLGGLALGAALSTRWLSRSSDPWGWFGLLVAAAGLLALLAMVFVGAWLPVVQTFVEAEVHGWTDSVFAGMCARFAVAAAVVVLPPTILLGAAFPAVLKLTVGADRVGQGIGATLALNTVGGIAGTCLTGFALIPALGLVRTLAALALAAAAIGAVAVTRSRTTKLRWGVAATAIAAIAAVLLVPPDQLARRLASAHAGQIAFYEEGAGGTVAVLEQGADGNRFHRLYIQGVSNSGDAMPSLRYMRLQALLPLITHSGDPRSALVIGYGTGITAGALSRYPGLDRRVVAELLPAVLRAAPYFDGTFGAATDPGLTIRVSDGRRALQRSDDRYDLITLEPPPPSAASVVNLYSTDFYRLAAARLNRDGVVAQWLPLATQNEEDTRALVRSFIDVFPYAWLWTTELHEMLLVGSATPLALDLPRIAARMQVSSTADALRAVGVASPAALIATFVTDRDGLVRFAGDAAAVTDDRPGIEYASWVRPGAFARVLPDLLALRSEPPVRGGGVTFAADLTAERAALDALYRAALDAYAGDREAWARDIGEAAEAKAEDPYFRWFIGSHD